jgi:predicted acetyltransferase
MPVLYKFLESIFPREDWLFQAAAAGEDLLYSWSPTCIFLDGQIIGNVSRFDVDIWMEGAAMRIAGFAGVATLPEVRRLGVAKNLLRAVLDQVDQDGLGSVLYTRHPSMYTSSGFQAIEQEYMMLSTGKIPKGTRDLQVEFVDNLEASLVDRIDPIYSQAYPDYDGKVIRDRRYWAFYRGYFNHAPYKRIALCSRQNVDVGYIRIEQESDRLLLSEFCCQPDRDRIIEQLYVLVEERAQSLGLEIISIALAEEHFLWRWLQEHGVDLQPETGAAREVFMIRNSRRGGLPKLNSLRWPLADKF